MCRTDSQKDDFRVETKRSAKKAQENLGRNGAARLRLKALPLLKHETRNSKLYFSPSLNMYLIAGL